MADGKVLLEVVVEGKNVKVVQRQVEGVTDAVNQNTAAQRVNTKSTRAAADAQDHFSRGLKGVGQSSLSSGKALSKQRDLIGSSSFVGAYATLAANLFAATAAFDAFKKAADVEKVIKSIEILGTSSGTNIKRIGENIQRITGYGLSMGESMKAASLGVSAGFDANQLETLAKVAKGASAALGRDLSDSYDRLIRGAAKLEPEILDELGIIVRIDKASQDYAAALGKTVQQLSQYEKTQAFINAINTQGITKFGLLADAVETSVYDKFSASLSNLATSALNLLSNFAKIPEFLNYLSQNMFTLGGAIALFASTISKQMLPVLYEGPQNAAIAARVAAEQATEAADVAKNAGQSLGQTTKNLPEGYKKLLPVIRAGTASLEDQKKAVNSLSKSIKYYDNALASGKDLRGNALSQEKIQEYTERLAALKDELKDFEDVQKGVSKTQIDAAKATARQNTLTAKSNTLLAASSLSFRGTLSGLASAFSAYKAEALAASASTNGLAKSFAALKAGAFTAVLGIRALGSALLAALPYLGLLITFGPIIYDWFKNKFFPETMVEKRAKLIESLSEKVTELSTFLSESNFNFEIRAQDADFNAPVEGLKLIAAQFREIRTAISSILDEIASRSADISKELLIAPAQAAITEARIALQEKQDKLAKIQAKPIVEATSTNTASRGVSVRAYSQAQKDAEIRAVMKELELAQKAVDDAESSLISKVGEARFETTVTRVKAAAALVPNLITDALAKVRSSKAFDSLTQETKDKVIGAATEKFNKAGNDYRLALEVLMDNFDTVRRATNGNVSEEVKNQFILDFARIQAAFDNATAASTSNLEQFLGKVNGMSDSVSNVQKNITEAAGNLSTPYDKALDSIMALNSGIGGTGVDVDILNQQLKDIFGQKFSDTFKFNLQDMQSALQSAVLASRNLSVEQGKLDNLESLASNLKNIAGVDAVLQKQRVKVIDQQIILKETDLRLSKAAGASAQEVAGIENQILQLKEQKINRTTDEIEAQQKVLDVTNKIFASQKQIFDLSMDTQKNRLLLTKADGTLSAREEDKLVRDQYADRLTFAQREYDLKVRGINLQYKLLEAQYKFFRAQAIKDGIDQETIGVLDEAMRQMGEAKTSELGAAAAELENQRSKLDLDLQKASLNFAAKVQISVGSVMQDIGDIFYDRVKNAVALSQQLAEAFAGAIDSAVDAFVDAIVEGKNAFKAIGDALRNSLRESFAEIAKSKIKEGIALTFEAFGNKDAANAIRGPEERAAKATETTATNTEGTYKGIVDTQLGIPKVVELLTSIERNTASCCMSGGAGSTTLTGGAGTDLLDRVMGSIGTGPSVQQDTSIPEEYANIDEMVVTAKRSEGIFTKIFGSIKGLLQETKDGNTAQSEGFSLLSSSIGSLAGSLLSSIGPGIGKTGGAIGGTLMNAGLASGNMWLAGAGAVASFLGFEKGGVMSSSGPMPLQKYANGGIARTPQLAMFGEGSRPEAYVPLPDGRSIPVTMAGGGAGNVNNISVNVAVDNKGNAQTQTQSGDNTEEYSRRLGTAISNAVKQEIFNQQRPGGLLYRGRR